MSHKNKNAEFTEAGYTINVTGRHLHVTEPMKEYAIEKIAKLEKYNTRIIDVNIVMDIQNQQHRVEIVLKVNRVKIKSSAASSDMYTSIDLAVDKVNTQLRKYKDKLQDHHGLGLKDIDMDVHVIRPYEDELAEINSDIEEENRRALADADQSHKIVSKETRRLEELSLEDALMRLNLSGDLFLIFKNSADQTLKVIYKRNDGNYGLIEPEVKQS